MALALYTHRTSAMKGAAPPSLLQRPAIWYPIVRPSGRCLVPANLTPDYERAEQKYRTAATDDDRLEALRGMFATIPKHKGTEKLQADLKRKMSQLRKAVAKR